MTMTQISMKSMANGNSVNITMDNDNSVNYSKANNFAVLTMTTMSLSTMPITNFFNDKIKMAAMPLTFRETLSSVSTYQLLSLKNRKAKKM